MSSPPAPSADFDPIQQMLSESDRAAYAQALQSYKSLGTQLASRLDHLKVVEAARDETLKAIERDKATLQEKTMVLCDLMKKSLEVQTNGKPKPKVFTDIHRMKSFFRINVANLYLNDETLKTKSWGSNAFINHLCSQYPVFEDLGNQTYKKASLADAQAYWRQNCGDNPKSSVK